MNKQLINRLILYIVGRLTNKDAPISTIRLVKYLYLIDYEYYKVHSETLTGIDWHRYHYGPYFFELPEIIRGMKLDLSPDEFVTDGGKRGVTFSIGENQKLYDVVEVGAKLLIDRVINNWAQEDLDTILDYVYTETEPMEIADYKDKLDFSRVDYKDYQRRPDISIDIPDDKVARIRDKLSKRVKEYSRARLRSSPYDKDYYEALESMAREDKKRIMLGGSLELDEETYNSIIKRGE